jgi:hypothetical protein
VAAEARVATAERLSPRQFGEDAEVEDALVRHETPGARGAAADSPGGVVAGPNSWRWTVTSKGVDTILTVLETERKNFSGNELVIARELYQRMIDLYLAGRGLERPATADRSGASMHRQPPIREFIMSHPNSQWLRWMIRLFLALLILAAGRGYAGRRRCSGAAGASAVRCWWPCRR